MPVSDAELCLPHNSKIYVVFVAAIVGISALIATQLFVFIPLSVCILGSCFLVYGSCHGGGS